MGELQRITKRSSAARGLSVLEVLVSAVILAVAVLAIHSSFLVGDASFRSTETKITANSAARSAMENITRELRPARNINVTQSAGSASISFDVDDVGAVTISWQAAGTSARRVLKNGAAIIGNNITALSFTDHTVGADPKNAVTVELTATAESGRGPDISVNLKEQVNLRLF